MAGPNVLIGTYQLKVTQRGVPVRLDDVGRRGFLDWCRRYLSGEEFCGHGSDDGARHKPQAPSTEGDHTIYGRVRSGDSGFSSDFVDSDSGDEQWQRSTTSAELIPFYFQIYAPRGASLAILVLQKRGNRGPYTFFSRELREAFRKAHAGMSLHMEPCVAESVLKSLRDGLVTSVRFTKYSAPADVKEFVRQHGLTGKEVSFEIRITANTGAGINLGRTYERLIQRYKRGQATDIPPAWQDAGDEIRLTVRGGEKERTLAFGTSRQVDPYEIITDRVQWDRKGHPTVLSVHREANSLVSELRDELGIHHAD